MVRAIPCQRNSRRQRCGRMEAFREPPVWSSGFSRSGPPEGGTPYRRHVPAGLMVPMHGIKVVGTLHEPPVWSPGFSRPGPPEGGTPYRWHDPAGFMVPMHGIKVVEALHEPPVWSPGFSRSGPPEGGTPYRWHDPAGFMVPMHGIKVLGAFHEPSRSGTGVPPVRTRRPRHGRDARATSLRAGPEVGAPVPRFMVPMHARRRKEALHETPVRSPGFSRSGPPEGG